MFYNFFYLMKKFAGKKFQKTVFLSNKIEPYFLYILAIYSIEPELECVDDVKTDLSQCSDTRDAEENRATFCLSGDFLTF